MNSEVDKKFIERFKNRQCMLVSKLGVVDYNVDGWHYIKDKIDGFQDTISISQACIGLFKLLLRICNLGSL